MQVLELFICFVTFCANFVHSCCFLFNFFVHMVLGYFDFKVYKISYLDKEIHLEYIIKINVRKMKMMLNA